jgi:hypothetical protein
MIDHSHDRLDSWKEIAFFFSIVASAPSSAGGEATEGLPVRRHQHRKLGSVFALKSEVSAWWKSRSADLDQDEPTPRATAAAPLARKTRLLVLPSRTSVPTPPRTISPTASPKK